MSDCIERDPELKVDDISMRKYRITVEPNTECIGYVVLNTNVVGYVDGDAIHKLLDKCGACVCVCFDNIRLWAGLDAIRITAAAGDSNLVELQLTARSVDVGWCENDKGASNE